MSVALHVRPARAVPPLTRRRRERIEALIERLIDQLDAADGDPDLEPDTDAEPDHDAELEELRGLGV
jgi:hypothetical protein